MLALSLTINVLSLVALGLALALCRDLGALAHDLMDATQRAKLRPPLVPDTLAGRFLGWLMKRRTPSLLRTGVFRPLSPANSPPASLTRETD